MSPSPSLPPFIDSTMMSTFRACPRKFYHEFCLGLRPTTYSIDLHAGGCFSAALETFRTAFWSDGLDVPTATGRALLRFEQEWGSFVPHKETAKTKENMWGAVESYIHQYPPRTDKIQPYMFEKRPSVEFSFAIPLEPIADSMEFDCPDVSQKGFPLHPVTGEPWIYCGRADLLGEEGGRIAILDEKTAGRLESNWADKWKLRSQYLGYNWALQHGGIRCNTTITRGIIITKTLIRHVEDIKQYPQFLIERWHEQLRRDLWRLTRSWQEGYFDFNLNETCTAYNHCQFMDLCSSHKPEQWYSTYEVRHWNPLAKNPIASPFPNSPVAKLALHGHELPFQPTLERVTNPAPFSQQPTADSAVDTL